jgi:DNA-directed RNA polymerase specialized sigma24 family protein
MAADSPEPATAAGRFPPTRRSAIEAVASDDPAVRARAFDVLVRAYWKPVYKHVRLRWRKDAEEAGDLTQAFFARALEKRSFSSYDVSRAKFRTYLKGSLDHFVAETARTAARAKRGGGGPRLSVDFDVAEEELRASGPRAPADVEACFDVEWTRGLFQGAVATLESKCAREHKEKYFEVFRRYVLEPELDDGAPERRPSYAALAATLGITTTDVTNYLSWTRREMKRIVLEALRDLTANEEEFRSEARAVLGVDP